mmetsp:Transcript_21491/g.57260  ORF Transcript_21491/g.57260 Transcript_21491/m.57260 type:complete len:82 (+) Transcript_21491:49-294(+)
MKVLPVHAQELHGTPCVMLDHCWSERPSRQRWRHGLKNMSRHERGTSEIRFKNTAERRHGREVSVAANSRTNSIPCTRANL